MITPFSNVIILFSRHVHYIVHSQSLYIVTSLIINHFEVSFKVTSNATLNLTQSDV